MAAGSFPRAKQCIWQINETISKIPITHYEIVSKDDTRCCGSVIIWHACLNHISSGVTIFKLLQSIVFYKVFQYEFFDSVLYMISASNSLPTMLSSERLHQNTGLRFWFLIQKKKVTTK